MCICREAVFVASAIVSPCLTGCADIQEIFFVAIPPDEKDTYWWQWFKSVGTCYKRALPILGRLTEKWFQRLTHIHTVFLVTNQWESRKWKYALIVSNGTPRARCACANHFLKNVVNSVNQVTYYWKAHVFPFLTPSHYLQLVTSERRYSTVNMVRSQTKCAKIQHFECWPANPMLTFPHWMCCWRSNSQAIVTNKVSF